MGGGDAVQGEQLDHMTGQVLHMEGGGEGAEYGPVKMYA